MIDESLKSDTSTLQDDDKVEQTMERIKASAKWLEDCFWGEFEDAFRSYEVKTVPIMRTQPNGSKVEDTTRTNIAMPDIFIATRRKSVRKSRRPPRIEVRSKDPQLAAMLTQMATKQWDKAGEQRFQRRHVLQGDLFGFSLKVHSYDQVGATRALRHRVDQVLDRIYAKRDEESGTWAMADPDEEGAVRADKLEGEDKAHFLAVAGPETTLADRFNRFEGPVSNLIFLGDAYMEPEFESVHASSWWIFETVWDAEKLAYMAAQSYKDPRTGEEKRIIDPKKIEELEETTTFRQMNEKARENSSGQEFRQTLRDVIFKSRPDYEARLIPGRRYRIHMEYTFRKGLCWQRFIGNEKVMLGECPVPWDLGGRYPISSYTPIPSLLWGIGDSTPRKGRFLWKLHNNIVNQRTDLVTNALKKLVALPKGTDLHDEVVDMGLLRVIYSDNWREIVSALSAPGVQIPREAWESEQQILRMIQMLEPAMIDFGNESQAVPNSNKVATLGLLQQRAADSIGADELEALNESIAEETDIKLSMWQAMLTGEDMKQSEDFWTISGPAGPDKPRKTFSDPIELQADFEVFPEMGSTLALDDVMKKNEALEMYMRAIEAPQVWDVQFAARRLAATYNLPNPEEALAKARPEQKPDIKFAISLALKWPELRPEERAQILAKVGIKVSMDATELEALTAMLKTMDEGATAAQHLAEGEQPEEETALQGAPR